MSISELVLRKRLLVSLNKIKKLAEEKNSPRWIIFFLDTLITLFSITLAYLLRFNFNLDAIPVNNYLFAAVSILSIRIVFSFVFKMHEHVIRYTTINDIRRIFLTISSGTFVMLAIYAIGRVSGVFKIVPLSIILIDFFVTLYFITNLRLLIKYIYVMLTNLDLDSNKTIIVGSKELAVLAKEALEFHPTENFKAMCFIDSAPLPKKSRLAGLPIFSIDILTILFEKYNISHLIFAKRDLIKSEKEQIGKLCKEYGIKMLTAPEIWLSGNVNSYEIREVNIEELLDREPINLSKAHVKSELNNKKILITGAAGSIGSELVRQIASYMPSNLILIDQAETPLYDIELELKERLKFKNYSIVLADILNQNRMERVFDIFRPDIIYHAAAYKHVPMMEANPVESFQNNVLGTKIVADLANKYKAERFVMISTDKAVNPTGIMGATKRMAEMYIQSFNEISKTNFITTRFGNVLNSNGSVIPRFLKQIREGGPVTVTHPEITRFFMTITEACQLVLEASVMGKGGEIFLFDMGEAVKILDLAKNLIKSTGHIVGKDIDIKFTGLRPGEKLYEELLLDSEPNRPTHHPKIMIADVCKYNYNVVKDQINKFAVPVQSQNMMQMVKLMKEMIPTYKSKNSVFEKLDKAV